MDLLLIFVAACFLFLTFVAILDKEDSWVIFAIVIAVCVMLFGFLWTNPKKTTEIVTITDRHKNMSFSKPVKIKTIEKYHDWTVLRNETTYEVNVD